MKCSAAIVLATMAGAIALQLPSPVIAQSGIIHNGGTSSRAEALGRESLLPPLVNRAPVPAFLCPRLEGYPDCH
jgi:hypothetical protein